MDPPSIDDLGRWTVDYRVATFVWVAKRNRRNRSSNQKFVGVLVDCKRLWLRRRMPKAAFAG
jgi:hypothetical protein